MSDLPGLQLLYELLGKPLANALIVLFVLALLIVLWDMVTAGRDSFRS